MSTSLVAANNLFQQFSRQLQRQFPQGAAFLLGLSGGLDSVALLDLLVKLRTHHPQFRLRAMYIHHGLSPNADAWQAHCKTLCHRLNVEFLTEEVQITGGNGIEGNARQARYAALCQALQNDEILLTAHHQTDQVETFFLNLKRGTGVQGLAGMALLSQKSTPEFSLEKSQTITHYRPLLPFSRTQLTDYATLRGLRWIDDESNSDTKFDRNFLRQNVLPLLRTRWHQIDNTVARAAELCAEQQCLINELLAEKFQQRFCNDTQTFDLNEFYLLSAPLQNALLRQWLQQVAHFCPSQKQLHCLKNQLTAHNTKPNACYHIGNKALRRYGDRLYYTPIFTPFHWVKTYLKPNEILRLPQDIGSLIWQENTLEWHSNDKVQHFSLPYSNAKIEVGFAQQKTPLPAIKLPQGHHESFKKLCQNAQIPSWQRSRIPLIFQNDQLIMALGVFNVVQD